MSGTRSFAVFMKCENCLLPHEHRLSVPIEEDAPSTIDELLESTALQSIPFKCRRCESTIAKIVAVKQPENVDAA